MNKDSKQDTLTRLKQEYPAILVGAEALEKHAPLAHGVTVRTIAQGGGFVTVCELDYREKISGKERDFHMPILRIGSYRGAKATPSFCAAADLVTAYVREFRPEASYRNATAKAEPAAPGTDVRARLASLLS